MEKLVNATYGFVFQRTNNVSYREKYVVAAMSVAYVVGILTLVIVYAI